MYCAASLIVGFAAGLFYSRGKADPVQAAWFDLKRHTRSIGREAVKLWRFLAGKATGRKRHPHNKATSQPWTTHYNS